MAYVSMIFLLLISFTASANDWPECFSNNDCPSSYTCQGPAQNARCVADLLPQPMACVQNSDCAEGYQCPRCWGEHCFVCTKKPTTLQGCSVGTALSCRPVWREPGYECSCRPKN